MLRCHVSLSCCLLIAAADAGAQEVRFSTSFVEMDMAAYLIGLDANGDGRDELIAWAPSPLRYAVVTDRPGQGLVMSETIPIAGDGPIRESVGDLNGDGLDDVVFINLFESQISVLLSNGDLTFSEPPSSPLPTTDIVRTIRIADVDLDGINDLLVGARFQILIYKGRGNGDFDFPVAFPTDVSDVQDIVFADLRHDGHPVMAVLSVGDGIQFFERNGPFFELYQDMSFGETALRATAMPFGISGGSDLVLATQNDQQVFTIRWDDAEQAHVVGPRSWWFNSDTVTADFGDLNGDGLDDVVYGVGDTDILRVFYADPAEPGLFHDSGEQLGRFEDLRGVAIADTDGDGVNELALAGFDKFGLTILRPQNGPDLRTATNGRVNPAYFGRLLEYTNPDGSKAVYALPESQNRQLYRLTFSQTGGITAIEAEQVEGPDFVTVPLDAQFGDLNNDGLMDLYSIGLINNTVRVQWQLASPDGSFGTRLNRLAGRSIYNLNVADLNGDGFDDAAALDYEDDVRIYFAREGTSLEAPSLLPMWEKSEPLRSLLARDLDGDGAIDLACFAIITSNTSVLLIRYGRGDGTFEPAVSFPISAAVGQTLPDWVDAGDVNSDAQLDIAVGQAKSTYLIRSIGARQYGPAEQLSAAPRFFRLDVLDLNGDGRAEVASVFDGFTEIVEFEPDGSISARHGLFHNPSLGLVFLDADNDGWQDLISSSSYNTTISFNISDSICPADLNRDGLVNFFDLATLISL